MHPIYLASITVGSKFHPGHMKRALYERITDHVGPLPSDNYKFNRPQMYATTSPETRQATKVRLNSKKKLKTTIAPTRIKIIKKEKRSLTFVLFLFSKISVTVWPESI